MKKVLGILIAGLFISGCAVTNIEAPNGSSIKIADANDQITQTEQFREVYLLWGLINLDEDKVKNKIASMDAEVLRITIENNFVDVLINALGFAVSVRVQTVIIEGGKEVTAIIILPCETCS